MKRRQESELGEPSKSLFNLAKRVSDESSSSGRDVAKGYMEFNRHLREIREQNLSIEQLEERLALARASKDIELGRKDKNLELAYAYIRSQGRREQFKTELLVHYENQNNENLEKKNLDFRTQLPSGMGLINELENYEITPTDSTLILLDIDRFKSVNDEYGHLTGDDVLFAAARKLEEVFKKIPGAIVARDGGEEFLIYLPVAQAKALTLLNKTSEGGEEHGTLGFDFTVPETERALRITFSGGIVAIAMDPITDRLKKAGILQAKALADRAVYSCKGRGRNRVEIFNEALHPEMADRRKAEDRRKE